MQGAPLKLKNLGKKTFYFCYFSLGDFLMPIQLCRSMTDNPTG